MINLRVLVLNRLNTLCGCIEIALSKVWDIYVQTPKKLSLSRVYYYLVYIFWEGILWLQKSICFVMAKNTLEG